MQQYIYMHIRLLRIEHDPNNVIIKKDVGNVISYKNDNARTRA